MSVLLLMVVVVVVVLRLGRGWWGLLVLVVGLCVVVAPVGRAGVVVGVVSGGSGVGDVTGLGPLPGVSGSGPVVPVLVGAPVRPGQQVAVSTQPLLRSGLSGSGPFRFQVGDVTGVDGVVSWRSWQSSSPDFSVPAGAGLVHGRSYQWQVTDLGSGKRVGPFVVTVDVLAQRHQDVDSSGGVGVGLASGLARFAWRSQGVVSASGDVRFGLDYSPVNEASDSVEVPGAGWRLVVNGASGYDSLVVRDDTRTVDVVSKNNGVVTYVDRGRGVFEPLVLSGGGPQASAAYGVLVRNGDGSFTMTDTTRSAVTFSAPNGRGRSFVTSETVSGVQQLRREYDPGSGRLLRVVDPVSGRAAVAVYGGDAGCESFAGFAVTPVGALCGFEFWDGSRVSVGYVASGAGLRLARIVQFAGSGYPQVTDFGYDQSGRLASVRSPLVAAALVSDAAASVVGSDPVAGEVLTQVSYDQRGRVAQVVSPAPRVGASRAWAKYVYDGALTHVVGPDDQAVSAGVAAAGLGGAGKGHGGRRGVSVRVVDGDGWVKPGRSLLRGRVSVPRAGEVVRIQERVRGVWKTVNRVRHSGDFRLRHRLTPGRHTLRAVVSHPRRGQVASAAFVVFADAGQRKLTVQVDPATLATVLSTNPAGGQTATVFDDNGNPTKTVDAAGGVTRSDYDGQGRIQTRTTAGGGRMSYDYDRTYSSPTDTSNGKAMRGLDVTYWPNASWSGAPASDQLGPKPNAEAEVPGSLDVTWAQPPIPGQSAWSARMVGLITLPAPVAGAKKKKATTEQQDKWVFQVAGSGSPRLWVDGVECGSATPCGRSGQGVGLNAGPHRVRIDMGTDGAGPGQVQLRYGRNGEPVKTVPMSMLSPNYSLNTSRTSQDTLAVGQTTAVRTRSSFEQPQVGMVGSSWNTAGLTTQLLYDDTHPVMGTQPFEVAGSAQSSMPRQSGTELPAGNQTGIDYWGDTQTAAAQCPGQSDTMQGGMPRSASLPNPQDGSGTGLTATTWYAANGSVAAKQVDGGPLVCNYYDDATRLTRSDVLADGQVRRTVTHDYEVDGNPLVSQVTMQSFTADGATEQSLSATRTVDLTGRVVSATDMWGTRVDTTYTTAGQVAQVRTTTASGYQMLQRNTYQDTVLKRTEVGDAASTVSAQMTYDDAQRLTQVSYSNGTSGKMTYNDIGAPKTMTWTDATGSDWTSGQQMADSGRVLQASVSHGTKNATFSYTYDQATRLSGAQLDSDWPATHTTWGYDYDANSNRTRQQVDNQTITYDYNKADQLTHVTGDPNLSGDVAYDNRDSITSIGNLAIDYDLLGDTQRVRDTTTGNQVTYQRDPAGGLIGKTTTPATGAPTQVRYAASGLILTPDNQPVSHTMALPGGVTVQRDLTAAGTSQQWSYPTLAGHTLLATDTTGTPTTTTPALYDPFGQSLTPTPTAPSPGLPRYGWHATTGQDSADLDAAAMLMGERLYLPALGRYTQIDPQLGGSANTYDYANQDPINARDHTGQAPWYTWLAVIAVNIALSVITYGATAAIAGSIAMAGLSTATAVASTVAVGMALGAAEASLSMGLSAAITGGRFDWGDMSFAAAIGAFGGIFTGLNGLWYAGASIAKGSFEAASEGGASWLKVIKTGNKGWKAWNVGEDLAQIRNAKAVAGAVEAAGDAETATSVRTFLRSGLKDYLCAEAKGDALYGVGIGVQQMEQDNTAVGQGAKWGSLMLSVSANGCGKVW